MPDPQILTDLYAALDTDQRLVEGVRADQWDAPTPCAEWNVRQLVNHMVTGQRMVTALAGGERPEGAQGLQRLRERVAPGPDEDPVEAFRQAAQGLRQSFSRPGFLEGSYLTPVGEGSGERLALMRTSETLVHGWDLARATGQSPAFDDSVVEGTLAMVRNTLTGHPRASWTFATEQPAPAGAPPLDRLAAFLGRPL